MAGSRPLSLPRGDFPSGESPVSSPKQSSKSPKRSNSFSFRLSPRPKTSTPKDDAVSAFPFHIHDAAAAKTPTGRKSFHNSSSSDDYQKIPFTLNKSKLERKISDIKTVIEMESETERQRHSVQQAFFSGTVGRVRRELSSFGKLLEF